MLGRNSMIYFLIFWATALLTACGGGERRQVIQNKGSDTLVNVAQAWAEAYQGVNPNVVVAVSGGGSGTGIAALINGTVDIANASRAIKDKESELAQKNGQDPVQHIVGYDALAIFLHADNPIDSFSIEQLKQIYVDGARRLSSSAGRTIRAPMPTFGRPFLVSRIFASGRGTCTGPRTWSTWSRKPLARSVTADWLMPPTM